MTEQTFQRLHAIIEGRVQGVGFRYFVHESAISTGITGWVRNRWDRTVEVVAEGEHDILKSFLAALNRGPRASKVTNIKLDWQSATGEFNDFRIRMTSI